MCGICGKISKISFDHGIIHSMNQALSHRGPDDEGTFFSRTDNRHIGLGHRRLSIIDLSHQAKQPMINEDQSVVLVANGEIYNYMEIRNRLVSLGHRFRSRSDSEVIIHAYEQWGTDCLKEFEGMFAFAIWDSNRQLLFMARDPFGEKPLFYSVEHDTLTFASELPALLNDKSLSSELDSKALMEYLHYQITFSPRTILKHIRKLPPGHFVTYQKGVVDLKDYIKSKIKPLIGLRDQNIEDCSERIKNVLNRIVEPLMISDVPIGHFLSGGLDSSLILAFMDKKAVRSIHTFSIGFKEHGYCELPYARKIADLFGTDHHEDVIDYDILGILPDLIRHLGEPMADASIIPYYHLSRLAASEVKVVLGGDGADEMWGGYRRHLIHPYLHILAYMAPIIGKLLSAFRATDRYYANSLVESLKLAQQLSLSQRNGYTPWNPLFDPEELQLLVNADLLDDMDDPLSIDFSAQCERVAVSHDSINRMLWIDQMTFLSEDILTKVDRMSMAHSLEVRAPFLHPEMASLSAGIPGRFKVSGGTGKKALKLAARDYLPSEIIKRGKHGFSVPIDGWFRGEGQDMIRDTLTSGTLVKDGWLSGEQIMKFINEHCCGMANHGRKLWSLLVLERWKNEIVS